MKSQIVDKIVTTAKTGLSSGTVMCQNRYGLGSAIAVMLTVLLMIITAFYLRTVFKQEEL